MAALLLGVGTALASTSNNSATIHGCYNRTTGALSIRIGSTCPAGTKAVSWNTAGPAGPAGPGGPQGPAGPQGPPGSQAIPAPQYVAQNAWAASASLTDQGGSAYTWTITSIPPGDRLTVTDLTDIASSGECQLSGLVAGAAVTYYFGLGYEPPNPALDWFLDGDGTTTVTCDSGGLVSVSGYLTPIP